MKKLAQRFCVAAAVAGSGWALGGRAVVLAQGGPSKDVVVVNGPAQPVPTVAQGTTRVRDVDHPARNVFQRRLNAFFAEGSFSGSESFVVPAGERLVIEHVSSAGVVPVGQQLQGHIQTSVNGLVSPHWIVLTPQGVFVNQVSTGSQLVRIYADPGTTVTLEGFRNGGSSTGGLDVTLSGHLVALP